MGRPRGMLVLLKEIGGLPGATSTDCCYCLEFWGLPGATPKNDAVATNSRSCLGRPPQSAAIAKVAENANT
eukprot:15145339-Alexandrium_andersonii.AAC.1